MICCCSLPRECCLNCSMNKQEIKWVKPQWVSDEERNFREYLERSNTPEFQEMISRMLEELGLGVNKRNGIDNSVPFESGLI